jgi:bifunctional DNA-binding transcriptional regulator/antitoxin component of YhaV-PrlF toxin-antitoxin module
MSLESTVSIAKVGTKSLRTTVPEGIVAFLGIKEGDKLLWKMDVDGGIRMARVQRKAIHTPQPEVKEDSVIEEGVSV